MAYPFRAGRPDLLLSPEPCLSGIASWLSGNPRQRYAPRCATIQSNGAHSRVNLEQLEPRYLLSAELMPFMVDMDPDGSDFTLRLDDATQFLEVIDSDTGDIVDQRALQETSEVRVTGSDLDDRLTVDFDVQFSLLNGIFFDGGFGEDQLHISNGLFDTTEYAAQGSGSGYLRHLSSGLENVLNYGALEGLLDLSVATERFFINLTGLGQSIHLADDATAGDGVSTIDNAGGEAFTPVSFAAPLDALTLQSDNGSSTFIVEGLDASATASVDVQGSGADTLAAGDGTNTWELTGSGSGSLSGSVDASFAGIASLVGGAGDDTFRVGAAGALAGTIDGGAGNDTAGRARPRQCVGDHRHERRRAQRPAV